MSRSKMAANFSFTPSPYTPHSSKVVAILLLFSSCLSSATLGYDGSMMSALNILPSYTSYFSLTPATLALNTATVYIGQCIASPLTGWMCDVYGRKNAIAVSAIITIVAVVLQAASQNTAMFAASRIVIGIGNGGTSIAGPVWLAECLPHRWRAWGLGLFYNFWCVGGLISAGLTYGTAKMESTWAWRLPSAVQGIFSVICIVILPFVPESPRWLAYQDRLEESLEAVAVTHSNGDRNDPVTIVQFKEITDTLERERLVSSLGVKEMVRTPAHRKRLMLAVSVSVITMLSGNNIVSYYLGTMLDDAGITDTTTQLEINIIMNAWCLVVALIGTYFMDSLGRKTMAIISTALATIFLFLFGGLNSLYGDSTNTSGIYGSVAVMFLFRDHIPSAGHHLFPFAMEAISYKTYYINGGWDVLELIFLCFCWVETKGKTLEEIDVLFDGEKHSDMPDIESVMKTGNIEVLHGQVVDDDEDVGTTVLTIGTKK